MEERITRPVAQAATGIFAVAAYWLRQRQLQSGGSFFTYFTVAVVVLLAVYALFLSRRKKHTAILSRSPVQAAGLCSAALALTAGSAAMFLSPAREFDRGLAVLGILAAVSWILQAALSFRGKKPHPAIYFLPVILWGVRLVRDFRVWSRDPVILDYCYSLLALIFALCAMLELGAFAFDRGRRRLTTFFTLGGVFFTAAALAGAEPRDVAITGGALLYLLTQSWVLLRPAHRTP